MQPEWARPPSTASSDGSKPVPTTPKPGQWVPDASTSTSKPVTTTRRVTSTTTTTRRPTEKPEEVPEENGSAGSSNEVDDPEECKGDFMPHTDCDKVCLFTTNDNIIEF